eukprot:m.139375 g.139375  ORF g.139375 m.139375 type:complete len:93 (+) comp30051_c0_seq2:107-385(+)
MLSKTSMLLMRSRFTSTAVNALQQQRAYAVVNVKGGKIPGDTDPASKSPFKQKIVVGGKHVMTADEPLSYGGEDLGPSPYDLLLSSWVLVQQ